MFTKANVKADTKAENNNQYGILIPEYPYHTARTWGWKDCEEFIKSIAELELLNELSSIRGMTNRPLIVKRATIRRRLFGLIRAYEWDVYRYQNIHLSLSDKALIELVRKILEEVNPETKCRTKIETKTW